MAPGTKIQLTGALTHVVDKVLTTPTQFITFTVDGNRDKEFLIFLSIITGTAAAVAYSLRFNNDAGSYLYHILNGAAVPSIARGQATSMLVGSTEGGANDDGAFAEIYCPQMSSGKNRDVFRRSASKITAGTDISSQANSVIEWENTANIEEISLLCDGADGFGIDTHYELWLRR